MNQKKLDKAIQGILGAGPVKDIPPEPQTKKNLNRKFKMRLNRKGKPVVSEAE